MVPCRKVRVSASSSARTSGMRPDEQVERAVGFGDEAGRAPARQSAALVGVAALDRARSARASASGGGRHRKVR